MFLGYEGKPKVSIEIIYSVIPAMDGIQHSLNLAFGGTGSQVPFRSEPEAWWEFRRSFRRFPERN
jgi:hypothetical protein